MYNKEYIKKALNYMCVIKLAHISTSVQNVLIQNIEILKKIEPVEYMVYYFQIF